MRGINRERRTLLAATSRISARSSVWRKHSFQLELTPQSLDLARRYCDLLVGMANGRVVFDDTPAALTDAIARELYGMEAIDVLDAVRGAGLLTPIPAPAPA